MHNWRLLTRLVLALLALTLVTGTVACLDSDIPVFPEAIDEDDSGNGDPEDPNDPGGGT